VYKQIWRKSYSTVQYSTYWICFCPSLIVNGKLFWGVDNMHLVEKELGNVDAAPLRLLRPPSTSKSATLTIFHDLASPWSFIGSTQVRRRPKIWNWGVV
jgi:2-hydroxychromene-2-carboxylate isomerase